jgi:hypothetical protein
MMLKENARRGTSLESRQSDDSIDVIYMPNNHFNIILTFIPSLPNGLIPLRVSD